MSTVQKKKTHRKIALILSVCFLIVWACLGTGASLAWFSDTSPEVNNIFNFADFELEVSHRLEDGNWENVDSTTQIFDDEALYEPGYTQVVYLKVQNKGTVPFEYKTAVIVNDVTIATNVFGQRFNLQDYLRFGITVADSEADMDNSVANRELAKRLAVTELNDYTTQKATLNSGEAAYMALIVRMPEEVTNVANYRLTDIPTVDLGVVVTADQIGNN